MLQIKRAEIIEAYKKVKLKYNFPYNLKNEQVDVIDNILHGKSIFAILPTGFGKSDCFALPPLLMDEVSRLII